MRVEENLDVEQILCAMVTLSVLYCGFYGGCLLSPGHGSIPGLKSTHVKQEKLCENEARWTVNNSPHGSAFAFEREAPPRAERVRSLSQHHYAHSELKLRARR